MIHIIVAIVCLVVGLGVGFILGVIGKFLNITNYIGELTVETNKEEEYATMKFSLGVPYVDDLRDVDIGYVKITFDDKESQDLHSM